MQRAKYKELISWFVILSVILTIYLTGLQTEVIGKAQQLVLMTGLLRPDTEDMEKGRVLADHDFPLITLDGKAANLSDFKGKVIFVNLWATWCPPCIAEMPSIHKLYGKIKSEDMVFAMISIDEDFAKAQKFVRKKDYTFPVYGLQGGLPVDFETSSIPTTFVIDRSGKIVLRKEGMAKYDTEEFRNFLEGLLKAK